MPLNIHHHFGTFGTLLSVWSTFMHSLYMDIQIVFSVSLVITSFTMDIFDFFMNSFLVFFQGKIYIASTLASKLFQADVT